MATVAIAVILPTAPILVVLALWPHRLRAVVRSELRAIVPVAVIFAGIAVAHGDRSVGRSILFYWVAMIGICLTPAVLWSRYPETRTLDWWNSHKVKGVLVTTPTVLLVLAAFGLLH